MIRDSFGCASWTTALVRVRRTILVFQSNAGRSSSDRIGAVCNEGLCWPRRRGVCPPIRSGAAPSHAGAAPALRGGTGRVSRRSVHSTLLPPAGYYVSGFLASPSGVPGFL